MSLDTVVSWGCLARVPARPSICVTWPRLTFLEPQGTVPRDSNPPRRHLFLRGMPTGNKAFYEMLGVFRLQSNARTHLKKALCHTRPFGGACDKYRWFNNLDPVNGTHFSRPWYQRHGSSWVCHVSGYSNQPKLPGAGSVEAKIDIPQASGGRPPRLLTSSEGLGLSPGACGTPFLRECQWDSRYFREC